MFEYMQSAEETSQLIAEIYYRASQYLSSEAREAFEKYMSRHNLTEEEARQLLNTLRDSASIQELLEKLQGGVIPADKAEILRVLESQVYRARIERFERLQEQIDLVMQQVYRQEKQLQEQHYIDLAREAYNRSVFDIQQRAGVGFSFSHIDQKQIARVINTKWSGKNYSTRIWKNTQGLAQDLKKEMLLGLLTGKTEREMSLEISKKYAQGAFRSRRLVRTESSYLANQMEMQSYQECGVDRYIYLATLDLRTCDKCCIPLDGKIFAVANQEPGKNCPPMHPWCRCTTIAYISAEALEGMKRHARDPVTGHTYLVPGSMTYREWYQEYVLNKTGTYEKGISNKRISKQDEYKINRNVIESNEYKRKFSGITGNSVVDESIYKYAKAGLIHRDGTNREDLYILSASKGTVLGKNVTSDEAFGVKPNESIRSAVINNQGDLIGLHTHPDSTPPTGSDFETAFKRGYHLGIVACSNGSVYTYGCANQFASARIIDDTIEKFKKMIDDSGKKVYSKDREAHLAAIKSLGKDYGIWYETR